MKRWLVVMLKEPRPGRVKTRLGREIGMVRSAWWFRHQTTRLLRQVQDPRWQVVLAVAPDEEGMASRVWPGHLPRIPQGAGNLGHRMARILRDMPPGPVCIVGGDIPGITRHHVARGFRALGGADAVFGPAPDGGYWMIGLRRGPVPSGLLENVRWSTTNAMSDSIASLGGLKVAQVDTLRDVDTMADLMALGLTA